MEYPQSSAACMQLASELIKFLKETLDSTSGRSEWTTRNFAVLDSFAKMKGLDSFHKHHPKKRREFLWDWTAYVAGAGLVVACESEWEPEKEGKRRNLKHDFEKLLSASCPVKLFVCRAGEMPVSAIKTELQAYALKEMNAFQPGTVFVLYCIDPHTVVNRNEDHVWWFQAKDEFRVSREPFELMPFAV